MERFQQADFQATHLISPSNPYTTSKHDPRTHTPALPAQSPHTRIVRVVVTVAIHAAAHPSINCPPFVDRSAFGLTHQTNIQTFAVRTTPLPTSGGGVVRARSVMGSGSPGL